MSFLKHKTNLFYGVAELTRMSRFFVEDGYRKLLLEQSSSFGVVNNTLDKNFDNFKVVEDSVGSGRVKIINTSVAIDSNGKLIVQRPISGYGVPNDGNWYWVKIKHTYQIEEEGTVSLHSNGILTGLDTKFLEVLRGSPDFPSKVRFLNSPSNQLDYEVVEVLNDNTALLAGTQFTSESNLKYAVVGTFTPGHIPPPQDRYPFQYDSCELSLVQEVQTNIPPNKIEGLEFYIARVRSIGGVISIHDKRVEQYSSTPFFNLTNITSNINPLVGVESVKLTHETTVRDHNLVQVGFGVRTTAWTLDAPSRAITFSTGSLDGGRFKSTSQFTDGDLDGWRIYFTDGSYAEVYDSQKQGTAIKCIVREVDPVKLTTGDILTVVPPVDEVQIRALSTGGDIPNVHSFKSFPSSQGVGVLQLPVPEPTYRYIIEYRYLKGGQSSQWLPIPSDTVHGYYDESSFDDNGNLKPVNNRKTYNSSSTTGFIELVRSPSSYTNFISTILTGDLFGYGEFELDNGDPQQVFTVGEDYMVQRCKGVRGGGQMTIDHTIGLVTTGANLGNTFTLIFDVGIARGNSNLTIYSGYVNQSNLGTPIFTFRPEHFDYPQLEGKSVILRCIYNGTDWTVQILQEDSSLIGDIKMVSNIDIADFPSGRAALGTKHQGWALCDGSNGTVNLAGRFIVGYNPNSPTTPTTNPGKSSENYGKIGNTGGQREVKLTGEESGVPTHTHPHSLITSQHPGHTHDKGNLSINSSGAHTHRLELNVRDSSLTGTQIAGLNRQRANDGKVTYPNGEANGVESVNSSHSHPNSSFSGSVGSGGAHSHSVTGFISSPGLQDANESHENRPNYIVVGFIQRTKQL